MAEIALVPIDADLASALDGSPRVTATHNLRLGHRLPIVTEVVGRTLARYACRPTKGPWLTYLAADARSRQVVGTCGFSGPPSSAGIVEISCLTFPGFEGRGYATMMAEELTWIAHASPEAPAVTVQTRSRPSGCTRILKRLGFSIVGFVQDPNAGQLWEWRRGPRKAPSPR